MSDTEGTVSRAEILPLMGSGRKSGEWFMAFCPSHADGQKHNGKAGHSLGLSDAGVLKCFAGCKFADVMTALRANAGERRHRPARALETRDDRGWPAQPKIAYEYRSPETGELLAVKGRFERPAVDDPNGKPEKTFRWRLPDGDYRDGIKSRFPRAVAEMPLFGAEEIVKADPERTVWFTEGEAACLAIRARNELATCGPWGASQTDFGNALEVLRGRHVILWPDNDAPGRNYMAEIKRALRPIARSVAVVSAPVPVKGDAVEYFQAGRTIEQLLANVLTQPTVDVLASDHFVVRVPSDTGPIGFEFTHLAKSAGSLECELMVTHTNPAVEPEPYRQRINLLSQSARSSLETALGKQFGKDGVNWTTAVSIAYARVQEAYLAMDRGVQVGSLPEVESVSFMVETILPDDQPIVIFGDGSSGKTYICYALALTIAIGDTRGFCGLNVRQGAVLVIDYETGGKNARLRFRRLMLGHFVDPVIMDDLPIYFWDADGVPLADQVDALKRFIDRNDIRLVIIDSGADACGGEPEKAGVALAYFNALSKLNVTSITISHVTNTDAESSSYRPFGSRYWHNRARRTWYVKRDQEEDSDDVDVALICRKVNDGRKPRPLAFHLHFDGDEGPVTISRSDFRQLPAFESEAPARDRVLQYLLQAGQASVPQICEATGLANGTVRSTLHRGNNEKPPVFMRFEPAAGGRGATTKWGVAAER